MKKLMVLSILIFAGVSSLQKVHAQSRTLEFFDKIKLEAGWGLSTPIVPTKNTSVSDFIGLNGFYLGTNYELNESWGVRGTYAYNDFQNKRDNEIQLTLHKFMAEFTLSIGNAISYDSYYSDNNDFDIIAHAGIGASLGRKINNSENDWMRNIQIGVMPTYRVLKKISIHFDITYVINTSQNYTFSGEYKVDAIEGYLLASIGLSIDLKR